MGVATNRARYFITLPEKNRDALLLDHANLRTLLLQGSRSRFRGNGVQGELF